MKRFGAKLNPGERTLAAAGIAFGGVREHLSTNMERQRSVDPVLKTGAPALTPMGGR
jgi:hypothetical protein